MGLELPDLDDREFAEILADARERIPVHAEAWTDHNVHDPGITILEVLAWLAESYGYQLDQVTDAHRRKYLKLMGKRPEPPKPATAPLRLLLPEGTPGATIPAGEPLEADDRSGEPKRFRTAEPVTLTRARLERVITERRGSTTDNTDANETPGVHFLGFGQDAPTGSALYLGFDADPFEAVGTLDIAIDFHEADLPEPATHGDEASDFEPTVAVSWQYCTDYPEWYRDDNWEDFAVSHDGTNRLYRGGTVRLERPLDWSDHNERATAVDGVVDREEELVWIRCRIDRPERGRLGHEVPPQFDSVAVNAVRARHRSRVEDEELERPDGEAETTARPGQTFVLEHAPVLERPDEDDVAIAVGPGDPEGALDVPWTQVDDFDASGPDDTHYVLDHATGKVRFGDEVRGAAPPAGQRVVARSYLHGGGTAGNVPESSSWRFRRDEIAKEGVYTYYCDAHRSRGMKGAIVVGEPPAGDGAPAVQYGDWFDDVPAYEGVTADRRGRREVTIEVGAEVDGEPVAFDPPAIRVDPGTVVRFDWRSDSHSVVVGDQPPDGCWGGHPTCESTGYAYAHTFEGSIDPSRVSVRPAGRAEGGRDAEPIDAALGRLQEDMRTPYRAVTADDYAAIATGTPGLRFGRARALVNPGEEPEDCERHPGVRVIVVPFSTRERPLPSKGFLEAVGRHLERHRLLTDRVAVEAPTYVGIGVDVELRIEPGYSESGRASAVEAALREFLHPLEGYEDEGWPLGRPVYQSELYEEIEAVEGVDCVLDVAIAASDPDARHRGGNVEIDPSALVYSADHDVTVRPGRDGCGTGF